MKKRNPAIVEAEKKAYELGFKVGFDNGCESSRMASNMIFSKKINELEQVKGIGPKTFALFAEHFKEFLVDVPDEVFERLNSKNKQV